jgi:hypothetical protein
MLDTLETPQTSADTAQTEAKRVIGIPFTRANAAEMAKRAHIKRLEKEERKRLEEIQEETERKSATPKPDYVLNELSRTRTQIAKMNDRLDRAIVRGDARDLKFIADSVAKLREVERILDGRPLPGVNKPTSPPRKGSNSGQISPLD